MSTSVNRYFLRSVMEQSTQSNISDYNIANNINLKSPNITASEVLFQTTPVKKDIDAVAKVIGAGAATHGVIVISNCNRLQSITLFHVIVIVIDYIDKNLDVIAIVIEYIGKKLKCNRLHGATFQCVNCLCDIIF